MIKTCRICGIEKTLNEFIIHSIVKDKIYYRSDCYICHRTADNLYHLNDKDKRPEHYIWLAAKRRARLHNLIFELEVKDIIIPERCPILNIELQFHKNRAEDNSPSLDRLIPDKGYTAKNCFIISVKANRMKQENTLEDFNNIIKYIQDRL